MVQNILGYGIDIPLLGLREASKEVDGEIHELFTDECFAISNCFLLSTSQVTYMFIIKINTLYSQLLAQINKIVFAQMLHIYLIAHCHNKLFIPQKSLNAGFSQLCTNMALYYMVLQKHLLLL